MSVCTGPQWELSGQYGDFEFTVPKIYVLAHMSVCIETQWEQYGDFEFLK